MKIDLNKDWTMLNDNKAFACSVPCSVLKTLMDAEEIEDPYYRENEKTSLPLFDSDYAFAKQFSLTYGMLSQDKIVLRFEGIDTLADVYLNETYLGSCNNMHRTYEFDIKGIANFDNVLIIWFRSPTEFIAKAQAERALWGVEHSMAGYPHLRKGHYMFGWDWGPKLPDMGIWRDVSVIGYKGGRIRNVYYSQEHLADKVVITCDADLDIWSLGVEAEITLTDPDNFRLTSEMNGGRLLIEITDPQLWWVRGLGAQPLYTIELVLKRGREILDSRTDRIGLRTLTVSREKDVHGEEFCFVNNGVKVFAMGANYIPEDNILPKCTKERTRKLIRDCVDANFNFIRVWGGGVYPGSDFYNMCDECGIIVWQDFMFACSAYLLTQDFEESVREELKDNIIRLRAHPSLAMWCGNNEVESAWTDWGLPDDKRCKADYLKLFEDIIPETLIRYDPQRFYWPSSPSSGGGFKAPSNDKAGDMHYWAVWHGYEPPEAFGKTHYRFCSEYGFESLPDIKTCRAFADEKKHDFDLDSAVMRAHQKCTDGNEKIRFYLDKYVNPPYNFDRLVYCSQLVQAEFIRYFVEHMRRDRGRCMGSAYWQLNDSNPVISWSSIDYFGRWKALHYYARRFYAPIMVSCDMSDQLHPTIWVTNDTTEEEPLTVTCRLRNNKAQILAEYSEDIISDPMSSVIAMSLDFSSELRTLEDKHTKYIEYTIDHYRGIISKGTSLFVKPKEFEFLKARIVPDVMDLGKSFAISLTASCFAKSVCVSLSNADCTFSDNWFDIHGSQPVNITLPKQKNLTADSVLDMLRFRVY
ncbi:MAG: glycoside hydrolase family 2 protein [Ruminococcus sp.]|nr:glycoside hydrolase family 2 protein [Ruminococcus sp.]